MNITIRLAIPSDAPDMAEIVMRSWEIAYKDIVPADYIKERNANLPQRYKIPDDNTTYHVIQFDGKTIGIMTVAPSQDDDLDDSFYDLQAIYLHPDYFHQGIGTVAMEYAFEIARGLGKTNMTVWLLEDNHNAEKFYEKCGFAADGKTKPRIYGKELTLIRMRREL